jgi:tRNA(Ile2) C34 agmatinyltransferase TiaS
MTLIKCPECGGEVSSDARNCMHCGKATPKSQFALIFFVLAVIVTIILMSMG